MVVVQAEDIFLQLGSVFPVELVGINGHRVSCALTGWLIPTLDYKTHIYKISQFAFLSLFAEVQNHLNTTMLCGNTFERWRMMMFLLHCGVGCQERWSRPCTMSRHGPRYSDVQPVELLPICSNRKAEMISKRLEAGCVSLQGPSAASHTVILPVLGLRSGGELGGTTTTHLFLHASDTLHVRDLCEDVLFTSLRMPLCTQQHAVEHQLGRPPLCCFTKKLLNWNVWKDKFEDGRIGWDDLADCSADNNLKWWKKLKNSLITDFTMNVLQKLTF